jgi:hypothetical protein
VDPANAAVTLRKGAKNNVKRVSRLDVFDEGQNVIRAFTVDYEPATGENIETPIRFDSPISVGQIYYISVYFEFDDPPGTSSSVSYAWDSRLNWASGEADPGSSGEEGGSGCSGGASGFLAIAGLAILLMRRKNG